MLLLSLPALANGLTTHVAICLDAVARLPDGELRELLSEPALEDVLVNGARFPDGGYAFGYAYSEPAHWEPFQEAYRQWMLGAFSGAPWDDEEGREHLAFDLGAACHGMGDQVFDSHYMERARYHDATSDWANESMDAATDVWFAAGAGPQDPREDWVPTAAVIEVLASIGVTATEAELTEGHQATRIAIVGVGAASETQAALDFNAENFPWATAHILDTGVAGNPADEAMVAARYWQVLWDKMHGEASEYEPLMATFPADGGMAHERDATRPESRAAMYFSRGIAADVMPGELFHWEDAEGVALPFEVYVFYGQSSHGVILQPRGDLAEDTTYEIRADAGVPFIDGTASEREVSFTFSTAPYPVEGPEPIPPPACGCGSTRPSSFALGTLLALAAARSPRAPRDRSATTSG
jgi:hypothetical protein